MKSSENEYVSLPLLWCQDKRLNTFRGVVETTNTYVPGISLPLCWMKCHKILLAYIVFVVCICYLWKGKN
jgi:hypothetical protein